MDRRISSAPTFSCSSESAIVLSSSLGFLAPTFGLFVTSCSSESAIQEICSLSVGIEEGSSDFSSFRLFCVTFSRRLKTLRLPDLWSRNRNLCGKVIRPELDGVFRCRVDVNRCVNNNLFWDVEWFTCLDNLAVRFDTFETLRYTLCSFGILVVTWKRSNPLFTLTRVRKVPKR